MYHPTGRVLTVLELLQSRPGITGAELAMRLETDIRTVRRYISKLQDVGIPVEANPGRYGGYHLRPGYKLPPLIFSSEEASAIVLGLLGSPWLEIEQPQAAISGAISKITRVLPDEARKSLESLSNLMVLNERQNRAYPNTSQIIKLSEAIQATQTIEMTYSTNGETTKRVIEPYRLVGREGYWYLIAYCRLREDYRTFRLDRVTGLNVLEERFKRNEDFDIDAYVIEHVERYPGKFGYKVLFKTDYSTARNNIPAINGPLTEASKGILFEGHTDDFDYEARYLVKLNLPFAIIEPRELKDAMIKLAGELSASVETNNP